MSGGSTNGTLEKPKVTLPDEVIEGLRPLLESSDAHQFAIGDYLVGVVDEFGHLMDRAEIHRQLAIGLGVDTSTLRDRELTARAVPAEARARFPALTYSHWRALRVTGDKLEFYAAWVSDNLPMPVSLLRRHIKHNGDLPPAWISRWERLRNLAALLAGDSEAPPAVVQAALSVLEIQV